jgi:hypothetical protein
MIDAEIIWKVMHKSAGAGWIRFRICHEDTREK